MEKTTIYNAHKRWLQNGNLKFVSRKKMQDLQKGEYFIKDGILCWANTVTKIWVSWYDNAWRDHSTSNTIQLVDVVKFAEV